MKVVSGLRIALLTLTFAVIAVAPATSTHYDVTMTERDAGPDSERGTLELKIPTTGLITGMYRDFDGGGPHPVTGGRQNGLIWLDYENVRVTATLGPKGLDGRAFRGDSPVEYVFRAVLTP